MFLLKHVVKLFPSLFIFRALKDLRVLLGFQDQKALQDHLGKMACRDTLGNVEKQDFKARLALLVQEVLLDHRDQLVRLVQ